MKQKKQQTKKINENVVRQHKFTSTINIWEAEFSPNNFKDIFNYLKKNIWLLLLVTTLILGVFSNTFYNEFVSDDIPGFVENPIAQNITLALKAVRWQETMYAIIYNFFGINPIPLHAASIGLHWISVILFFVLISNFIPKKSAIFATLLFSVHPLVTESVNWISASNYLVFSIFASLCSIYFILFRNSGKKKYLYISVGLYSFMVLTNHSAQSAFIVPMIVVIDQFLYERKIVWKNFKYLSLFFIPAILVLTFFLTVYKSDVTQVTTNLNNANTSYFYTFPYSIFMPLRLMFYPDNLTLYHDAEKISVPLMYTMIIVTISYLYFLYRLLRKNRKLLGLILLGHASFLFMISPIQISWFFAERYVYFATGIFCLILAQTLYRLDFYRKLRYVSVILLIVVLGFYSYRTYIRNADWKNSKTLWESTVKIVPYSARTYNNLGDVYARDGELDKSEEAFKKAIELEPTYAEAYHNLGQTNIAQNNLEKAEKNFLTAVELNPNQYQSYFNIAVIRNYIGDKKTALENVNKALEINPEYTNAIELKKMLTEN